MSVHPLVTSGYLVTEAGGGTAYNITGDCSFIFQPASTFVIPFNKPIFYLILAEIKSRIDSELLITNGYSADYGDVDDFDPASRVYPCVFLEYPEEIGKNENENIHNRYTVTTPLTFRVISALSNSDFDRTAMNIVSDLGHFMADSLESLQAVGMVQSDYINFETAPRNNKAYPIEVSVNFSIQYRRQKEAPYLT